MLNDFVYIVLWSLVCFLAAYGWINKVVSEGGIFDFLVSYSDKIGLRDTKLYTVLFGCESCLSGQFFFWTSWLYYGKHLFIQCVGSLVCIGISYMIVKYIFKTQ
jgi:hypothetical protein